jgi:hypothetical protein
VEGSGRGLSEYNTIHAFACKIWEKQKSDGGIRRKKKLLPLSINIDVQNEN